MENIFTHWESVINFTRNDIVFEHQNKEYGAYTIRKYYPERLRNAFLYSIAGMVLLFVVPLLLQKSNPVKINVVKPRDDIFVIVNPVLPEEKIIIPTTLPPVKQIIEEAVKIKVTNVVNPPSDSDPPQNQTQNTVTQNTTDVIANGSTDVIGKGTEIIPESKPVLFAQEMPEFVGGESALDKFLQDNLRYPEIVSREGITGRIYITFVIDKTGKVTNPVIARGIAGGGGFLEEEALRVVRLMSDWRPGRNNGHPVAVQLTLPINFVLRY